MAKFANSFPLADILELMFLRQFQLPCFSKRILCILSVLFFFAAFSPRAFAAENIQFYFSKTFVMGDRTPSLIAEESMPRRKWFDDESIVQINNRIELGINDYDSGYGIGVRSRTFDGHHFGAAAAYECLFSFCSWVSGPALDTGLQKEEVRYKISSHQVWIKKETRYDQVSLGAKLGASYLSVNANLGSTFQTIKFQNEVILPLAGLNARYAIDDKWDMAFDLAYVNISRHGSAAKLIEMELELGVRVGNWVRIAVGDNRMLLKLSRRSDTENASLSIPQQGPYLKVMVIY